MPLFGHNRFRIRKAPPRKPEFRREEVNDLDFEAVKVKLGGVTAVFQNGEWSCDIPKNKDETQKEIIKNRSELEKLKAENNMLRVKNEVLLDTVTVQKGRINHLEQENRNIQRILERSRFPKDD